MAKCEAEMTLSKDEYKEFMLDLVAEKAHVANYLCSVYGMDPKRFWWNDPNYDWKASMMATSDVRLEGLYDGNIGLQIGRPYDATIGCQIGRPYDGTIGCQIGRPCDGNIRKIPILRKVVLNNTVIVTKFNLILTPGYKIPK
ncbi:hypothetical protein CHS0354_030585 [Potamilus streckersoni]|uniref:Uncharacterized protein n=1 Tax=Potamilus streckersoni TaxID=2493646 RepID=A0AAE0SDF8_9BIVA|nr:hypothetical protein CHS0354_030585 [Potamilus streckersoni]